MSTLLINGRDLNKANTQGIGNKNTKLVKINVRTDTGGLALRFHHNFVASLTVGEDFSVKFILLRKSVRAFVGELGCQ